MGLYAVLANFVPSNAGKAQDGPWLIWGIGNTKCATYTEVLSSTDQQAATRLKDGVFIWATGFMSGMNLLSEEAEIKDLSDESVSREALEARILGQCYETPSDDLVKVIATIYGRIPLGKLSD
ncbi:MAG TPA: hypothetical protein VK146_06450 [Tabrizicola sp.]|nr:hypothetical protein [Tabrizicola sp.]